MLRRGWLRVVLLFALAFAPVLACRAPVAAPPAPVRPPPGAPAPGPDFVVPPPPTVRLPPLARPVRQALELWLDPHLPTFHGRVAIDLQVLQATHVLWVNATELSITEVHLESSGPRQSGHVLPGGEDFVGFAFDQELRPGNARLSIEYGGSIDEQRSRGIYAAKEGNGQPYLYTFFEPVDARRAFPCFDEPSFKIPWTLSFHVPRGNVALANASVVSETDEAGGRLVQTRKSAPLPSYLVAFVVGPFDVIDAGAAGHFGTPLRFVVPAGRGAETKYAASVTPKLVGLLEDYFGMPYPYGKLDVAVVPRYWGTMEHPGLLAMGQPLTLIRSDERSLRREQRYANIAGHELAHYWFGDYVTTAWWDDTWLNEALGTWMDQKVTDDLEPAWGFDRERVSRAWSGMQADALPSARSIRRPVRERSDIESSFDNEITYFKGQAVVGMFESWMTPERFQHAIQEYVRDHAWESATSETFFDALNAEEPGVGPAIRTFVDQPGVPTIALQVSCAGDARSIELRQRRYQPRGAALPPETWHVPVCVRYGGPGVAEEGCTLLEGETGRIAVTSKVCPEWVVGNADGAGYYHVGYSSAQLRAALGPGAQASATERMALLHDADALVTSGELPLADALSLLPATASSDEHQVFEAGLDVLDLAPDAALDDAESARLARWVRGTYAGRQRELGLSRRKDDGPDESVLRPKLFTTVALRGRDEALRKQARAAALAWLKDPKAVEPELVDGVLAAAAKTNDAELFAKLMTRIHAEPDHTKVQQLAAALGAFTAPEHVRRAQELLTGPELDVRDTVGILWAELGDRATRESLWKLVQSSFDALSARMRADDVLYNLFALARDFCDDDHRRQAEALFSPRAARFDGGPYFVAKTLESIGRCAQTFRENKASLDAFLSRRGPQ